MNPRLRRSADITLRIMLAAACCLAIWSSWKLARADYLFHQDTEQSVREAVQLVPDGWQYYMRLAQFDRQHTQQLLTTALLLNRYDAQADIELGLQYENDEDYARAEKLFLDAYDVDHTYVPRWSLANYYLRRGNMPAFWAWARSAASMPADEVRPLFELCWRVSPDAETITHEIINQKPELIRQYIDFLLAKNQVGAIADVAPGLVRNGDMESDLPELLMVVNRLVAVNDADAANTLWHLLMEQHWVAADTGVPNNANFQRDPLPVSFDWSLPEYPGLHSWPGASGLETEFTGSQPEDCTVAEQIVMLTPGNYTMTYSYRTSGIPPDTGIRWQIIDPRSNAVLSQSTDLTNDAIKSSEFEFSVSPGISLLRLRLAYRRALGTPRISGMLVVLSTQIKANP